jgi:hypothetical protein
MSIKVVIPTDLGTEFDLGGVTPNKITVKQATNLIPGKVRFATPAEITTPASGVAIDPAGVAAMLAANPSDKYVSGLSSYNAATNTLNLLMSDATIVPVDMTSLLADVAVATNTVDGTVKVATLAEVIGSPTNTKVITSSVLRSFLLASQVLPVQVQNAFGTDIFYAGNV